MTTRELLAKVELLPVTKGRNLARIGWADGYLVVRYHGKPDVWVHGPDIAEAERDKILRVPYPDALWAKLRKKHADDWKSLKVPVHA